MASLDGSTSRRGPLDNSGDGPLRVPGFSDYGYDFLLPQGGCFAQGFARWRPARLTTREVAMIHLMDAITDSPEWEDKIYDDGQVAEWRRDLAIDVREESDSDSVDAQEESDSDAVDSLGSDSDSDELSGLDNTNSNTDRNTHPVRTGMAALVDAAVVPLLNPAVWDWVLRELRDKAARSRHSGWVFAIDCESRCIKGDRVVSLELHRELLANAASLLVVPVRQRYETPDSDDSSLLDRSSEDSSLLDGSSDDSSLLDGSSDDSSSPSQTSDESSLLSRISEGHHIVHDLVDPSLSPLVYNQTRVLSDGGRVDLANTLDSIGRGNIAPAYIDAPPRVVRTVRNEIRKEDRWSSYFQWLPCEVEFASDSGSDVRITSYINNLHPIKHSPLYGTLEKLIGLAIPLWNEVLFKGVKGRTSHRIVKPPPRPTWLDKVPESIEDAGYAGFVARTRDLLSQPDHPEADCDVLPSQLSRRQVPTLPDFDRRLAALTAKEFVDVYELMNFLRYYSSVKYRRIRGPIHRLGSPLSYEEWKGGLEKLDDDDNHDDDGNIALEREFRKRGLQVIVRLTSVDLDPDEPTSQGSAWHLDGMWNEHIVATAIYYYDVENVSPQVAFRHETLDDSHSKVFNVRDDIQRLGRISTLQGRLVVFPNTLQRKERKFALEDESRPGHQRFVVLHLVDPHYRICSTRNVPPQQYDWWAEVVLDILNRGPLLPEINLMIMDEVLMGMDELDENGWPMGLNEAKRQRALLLHQHHCRSLAVSRFR